MKYLIVILMLTVMIVPNTVVHAVGIANNIQETTQQQTTTKKEKRLKRIMKKLDAIPSKTKGILALVAGVLTLVSVWFSIGMSLALSVPGVIVGIVLATLLGTAAMILGITAIKEDSGGKVVGLVGVIIGGVGLLMLIGLTIGNLFFS